MSIDRRIGNKLPDFVKVEDSPGYRINPGPFLGKIKNNKDPTFSGRMQVWIADFGGDEDNEENWRTVSYASPYMGSTLRQAQDKNNKFSEVSHSYGMWFTVPDIGNLVLCTFVAGDPSRGYWFACIPNNFGKHMIPAIAVSKDYDADNLEDKSLNKIIKHSKLPVVEFNENNSPNWEQFKTIKKPIHEEPRQP